MKFELNRFFTTERLFFVVLSVVCFFVHLIPRFLVDNWLATEEEYVYMIVESLLGSNPEYAGFYPSLTQRMVIGLSLGGLINPEMIAKAINPFFVTLTLIPLYYLVKDKLTKSQTYTVLLFFVFSEAVFYRTAYFGSTEAVSFFFALSALAVYQKAKTKKMFALFVGLISLSLWSHILPAIFVVGTVFVHRFLFGNRKEKIVGLVLAISVALLLLSPFSPHKRIVSVGNPLTLLSNFSVENLFLYSGSDLLVGAQMFLGLLALFLLAVPSVICSRKKSKLQFSFLAVAVLFFGFSWVAYSPQVFAPPRLTFYFIVPLAYFATLTVWKLFNYKNIKPLAIGFILSLMILSVSFGLQPLLWVNNSLTNAEYQALNDNKDIINNVNNWWMDYPVRIAVTRMTINSISQSALNETEAIISSQSWINASDTLIANKTGFSYVFYSERMAKEGLFIVYSEGQRTQQIRKPVENIWENSSLWELIYENSEVKVYAKSMD